MRKNTAAWLMNGSFRKQCEPIPGLLKRISSDFADKKKSSESCFRSVEKVLFGRRPRGQRRGYAPPSRASVTLDPVPYHGDQHICKKHDTLLTN